MFSVLGGQEGPPREKGSPELKWHSGKGFSGGTGLRGGGGQNMGRVGGVGMGLVEKTTVGPVGQWFNGELRGW